MPFPQLVSLFLRANKIWYLEPNEPVERLLPVGRNQIGKLGITLPLRPRVTTPRKGAGAAATETSRMDDTQSSAPPPSSAPSFFGSTLQTHLKEILSGFHVDIANTNAELVTHVNHKMGQMFEVVNQHHQAVLAQQQAQTTMLLEIVDLLRSLHSRLDSMAPGPSSVPSTSAPPSDPTPDPTLFTVHDPHTSTQYHVTLEDPSPSHFTPAQPTTFPAVPEPSLTASIPHTEPLEQPSPHQSPQSGGTEQLDEDIEVTQPSQPSQSAPLYTPDPHDPIQIPPLQLPEPIPSDSPTFAAVQEDDPHDDASSPIPATPLSAIRPSSQSEHSLSADDKKGEKD